MQILMVSLEQFCTFLLDCSSKHDLRIKHLESIQSIPLYGKKEDLLSSGCCFTRLFKVMAEALNMLHCTLMPYCEILMM